MPSITQTVECDISDFTDNEIYEEAINRGFEFDSVDLTDDEIREQYNARFGEPVVERDSDALKWIRTYMNNGDYREVLYKLETIIPEIRGLTDKIFN